jgi:hypothetical protein
MLLHPSSFILHPFSEEVAGNGFHHDAPRQPELRMPLIRSSGSGRESA